MESKIDSYVEISAVVTRKDGTIEDLGVIASEDRGNVIVTKKLIERIKGELANG